MTTKVQQPNLVSELYKGPDVPSIIERYSDALIKTGEISNILHGNALKDFNKNYVKDRDFISLLRDKVFNGIYKLLDNNYPTLCFFIEGRRKSLVKTEQKILSYQSKNKSLDLLRDLLAFRIVLLGSDPHQAMLDCYNVMQDVMEHCILHGFVPCDVDGDNIEPTKHIENILVPERSMVSSQWKFCVKDYIYYHKNSGYQALHIVFRSSKGKCFEVQIKSISMHLFAEVGSANHEAYNQANYGSLQFDREKVNVDNYIVTGKTNEIFDYAGLEYALCILRRQKTFIN